MCDQFRFDCINALGNTIIQTPNLDRLVKEEELIQMHILHARYVSLQDMLFEQGKNLTI